MSQFDIGARIRKDEHGKIVFMVRSGGYIMCRRPGKMPFVLSEKQWRKLEPWIAEKEQSNESA